MIHPFTINSTGELIVTPSSTSSQNDFDFFVGKWDLRNRKLKECLSSCTEIGQTVMKESWINR